MTLMQRYLTNPDDPESEADIQMQIMISQAAVDSKSFEVLVPQSVESIKRVSTFFNGSYACFIVLNVSTLHKCFLCKKKNDSVMQR